jgi:hypothetical protein
MSVMLGGLHAEAFFALEQCTDFGLTETAVTAWGTDAADPSGCGPPRDRLRVDAEQSGHLARREQTISSVHNHLLASTKGAIPARAGRRAIGGTYSHYSTVSTPCLTNHDSVRSGGSEGENARLPAARTAPISFMLDDARSPRPHVLDQKG